MLTHAQLFPVDNTWKHYKHFSLLSAVEICKIMCSFEEGGGERQQQCRVSRGFCRIRKLIRKTKTVFSHQVLFVSAIYRRWCTYPNNAHEQCLGHIHLLVAGVHAHTLLWPMKQCIPSGLCPCLVSMSSFLLFGLLIFTYHLCSGPFFIPP